MEFGPRSLGNRSILYPATEPSVNNWLNQKLERSEFMPFAPVTLMEKMNECYLNTEGAEDTAQFMTITFECTDEMKNKSPAVVHVDGTARPQLISKKNNPRYHRILSEYYNLTGIPSIVNTSFNMHEEPIVSTELDAVNSFLKSGIKWMALGNYLVKNNY
jgi:carbamoyltransferase